VTANRPWTADEVALLKRLWLDERRGKPEIAERLGRSVEAVKYRIFAHRLLTGGRPGPGPWPEAREQELRRLWERGDSAAEIADALGVGRNAVLAKVRRLGLPSRRIQVKRRRPVANASPWFGAAPRPRPAPLPPRRSLSLPEPESRAIPFIDLRPGQCKWIAGDGAPWLACGHGTGGPQQPWCPYHAELARLPPEDTDTGLAIIRAA